MDKYFCCALLKFEKKHSMKVENNSVHFSDYDDIQKGDTTLVRNMLQFENI